MNNLKTWYNESKLKKIVLFTVKWKLVTLIPLLILYVKHYNLEQDYEYLLKSNTELVASNNALEKKVIEVESANESLISNMVLFNRNFEDFPFPIWQKVKRSDAFIMQYVNPAYVNTFLTPLGVGRYEYIGKTDFDIHRKALAQEYYTRDYVLALDGGVKRFTETILVKNKTMQGDVTKWRRLERNDTLIYGMVIPK